jgi:hypothetical protein
MKRHLTAALIAPLLAPLGQQPVHRPHLGRARGL